MAIAGEDEAATLRRPPGDAQVLIVAGSDSSGGAGIVRDIETVAALGVKSCVAITAVTVQTHGKVGAIRAMPAAHVAEQMRAALGSNAVGAIKIGMLGNGEILAAVVDVLRLYPQIPVVLDPVLSASAGGALLSPDAIFDMRKRLLPLCTLVTPNLPELARLTKTSGAGTTMEATDAALRLLADGAKAVLVKGGHAADEDATDTLMQANLPAVLFSAPRSTARLRGTGCMLASAIAAHLARGETLEASIRRAKAYVSAQFAAAA